MSEDLYEILGIPPDADDKEVHSAYRSLAKKYHPDSGKGSSDEKFREVQCAYDVLHDAERRAAYDRDRERTSVPQWAPATDTPVQAWRRFTTFRQAPYSPHIDLRCLGRRPASQRARFDSRPESDLRETDPWEELIAFLFSDDF